MDVVFSRDVVVIFRRKQNRHSYNTMPDIGDISSLATGEWDLHVPVYVSHGEREDHRVVARIRDGTASINNIHLLSERATHTIAGMRFVDLHQHITSSSCAG